MTTTPSTRPPHIAAQIEQQLGIPGKYGNWWTARRLLQETWKRTPRTIRDCSFDLREIEGNPFMQVTGDILWRRALSPAMIGRWVQLVDKRSMYLSACKSVKTGIGDPVHVEKGQLGELMPGAYRVIWDCGQSQFNGKLYPLIIDEGDEWVTLDVLYFAIGEGYNIQIEEAWMFPEHARVLEKWATILWDARQNLTKMGLMEAANAINDIAHVGPGAFATNKQTHPGIDLIHPNWWADVVGKARINVLANLKTFGPPVCIRTDGLYFITRGPETERIASVKDQSSILARQHECGGYRVPTGFIPFQLTQEIYDEAEGLDHAGLSAMFKKYGGIKS